MAQPWAQSAAMGSATPRGAAACLDGEDFSVYPEGRQSVYKKTLFHINEIACSKFAKSRAEPHGSDGDVRHLEVRAAVPVLGCSGDQ